MRDDDTDDRLERTDDAEEPARSPRLPVGLELEEAIVSDPPALLDTDDDDEDEDVDEDDDVLSVPPPGSTI